MAQIVKNPVAMQEMWVCSLDQEDAWRREWLPTPEFLPGKFQGQRSLAGYSPRGQKESDITERLSAAQHTGRREGFPRWLRSKESTCLCRRHEFNPWVGKISWRGESHEQRSLEGYSPWCRKESDMTEHTPRKMRTRR